MKSTVVLTWVLLLLIPIFMMIGHFGSHDLQWAINPISTYAALAPNKVFITSAMYLATLGLLGIAKLVTMHRVIGSGVVSVMAPVLVGGAISGLLLIASHEETIQFMERIEDFGIVAIQQQAFHNAGWMVFFYSIIGLLLILGAAVFFVECDPLRRLLGLVTFVTGPLSLSLVYIAWYTMFGLANIGLGLNQRLTIFVLWVGLVSFVAWVSVIQHKANTTSLIK